MFALLINDTIPNDVHQMTQAKITRRELGQGLISMSAVGSVSVSGMTAVLPPLNRGFCLNDPNVPANGQPITYSSTNSKPVWKIDQWSIDGGRLGPWTFNKASQSWDTAAASASVKVSTRRQRIEMFQDGTILSCGTPAAAREFDLLFSPVLKQPLVLSSAKRIVIELEADISFGIARAVSVCPVNMGGACIGVVLSSEPNAQTFFYQFSLRGRGMSNGTLIGADWPSDARWYAITNPFGVDQYEIGGGSLRTSDTVILNVDILSRLNDVIRGSPSAMNKSNWTITGLYAGQRIWGNITQRAIWKKFQLWHS